MESREKEWLEQQESRLEALRQELTGVLQTTRKWDATGSLQVLEVKMVLAPPWQRKFRQTK